MSIIKEAIGCARVGVPVVHEKMTMYPLYPLSDGGNTDPDYIILDEALASGRAHVAEISEAGSVPELKFVNESDRAVLLVDGEELIGAKQNRILNLTILVAARTETKIPVSCVEAGRWAARSAKFASSPRVHYSAGRAAKVAQVSASLSGTGRRHSDQMAIWDDIAEKMGRLGSTSPTSAMSEMFESHSGDVEQYVGAFKPIAGQVGAVFAIDGRIAGLDLFDFAATWNKLMPKLVRSYALDAVDLNAEAKSGKADSRSPEDFLAAVASLKPEQFDAIGEGQDLRLSGNVACGAALVAHGRVVHLNAFPSPASSKLG